MTIVDVSAASCATHNAITISMTELCPITTREMVAGNAAETGPELDSANPLMQICFTAIAPPSRTSSGTEWTDATTRNVTLDPLGQ